MHSAFQFDRYLLKKQVPALTGIFRIYNHSGQMLLYSRQTMFRLRKDIRVYSDKSMSQELLYIQARQIIDFSAAYDVIDSTEKIKIGALRRHGWRSFLRDRWDVLDERDQPLGILQEDSQGRALLRRAMLGVLFPQNYDVLFAGQRVADFRQKFNLLQYKLSMDFSDDPQRRFDRRLGIAAGILLSAVEGRQTN